MSCSYFWGKHWQSYLKAPWFAPAELLHWSQDCCNSWVGTKRVSQVLLQPTLHLSTLEVGQNMTSHHPLQFSPHKTNWALISDLRQIVRHSSQLLQETKFKVFGLWNLTNRTAKWIFVSQVFLKKLIRVFVLSWNEETDSKFSFYQK